MTSSPPALRLHILSLILVLAATATIADEPGGFEVTIEDFDDGSVELISYPEEDLHPDSWILDSTRTFDGSPWSLVSSRNILSKLATTGRTS